MKKFKAKLIFYIRYKILGFILTVVRTFYWRALGAHIGNATFIGKCYITWPHKIYLSSGCNIENHVSFKYDGIYTEGRAIVIGENTFIGSACEFNISNSITIGKDCLIASGAKFIDHNHGMNINKLMRNQQCLDSPILIGDNVWLGANVIILKGVNISSGAVIAAGSIVTKSIKSNEIWAGVPAKKIGMRI